MKRRIKQLLEQDLELKISDLQVAQLTYAYSGYTKFWNLESRDSAVIGHLFGSLHDNLINLELQFGVEHDDVDLLYEIFTEKLPLIKEKLSQMIDE